MRDELADRGCGERGKFADGVTCELDKSVTRECGTDNIPL